MALPQHAGGKLKVECRGLGHAAQVRLRVAYGEHEHDDYEVTSKGAAAMNVVMRPPRLVQVTGKARTASAGSVTDRPDSPPPPPVAHSASEPALPVSAAPASVPGTTTLCSLQLSADGGASFFTMPSPVVLYEVRAKVQGMTPSTAQTVDIELAGMDATVAELVAPRLQLLRHDGTLVVESVNCQRTAAGLRFVLPSLSRPLHAELPAPVSPVPPSPVSGSPAALLTCVVAVNGQDLEPAGITQLYEQPAIQSATRTATLLQLTLTAAAGIVDSPHMLVRLNGVDVRAALRPIPNEPPMDNEKDKKKKSKVVAEPTEQAPQETTSLRVVQVDLQRHEELQRVLAQGGPFHVQLALDGLSFTVPFALP
jgi:hypothetical protein